jgi:hypothetical protein
MDEGPAVKEPGISMIFPAGEMTVAYCPTGDILDDFFTKALQGSLFQKFRNLIMNASNGVVFSSSLKTSQVGVC